MGLKDLSRFSAFLWSWFSPLIRERERGFSDECEQDLCLIAFVNVLQMERKSDV
jgi:hypothetical protein